MGIFGWSYPPGCEGTPFDEPEPRDDLPTVSEFCDHIGIEPLWECLRAIDKYNIAAVDVMIERTGEWLTEGDRQKCEQTHPDDPIEAFRVRGIAWDGSDWEYCEIVPGEDGFNALDQALANFEAALDEHNALSEMEEEN